MRLLCDVMVDVSLCDDKCTLSWRAAPSSLPSPFVLPHLYPRISFFCFRPPACLSVGPGATSRPCCCTWSISCGVCVKTQRRWCTPTLTRGSHSSPVGPTGRIKSTACATSFWRCSSSSRHRCLYFIGECPLCGDGDQACKVTDWIYKVNKLLFFFFLLLCQICRDLITRQWDLLSFKTKIE